MSSYVTEAADQAVRITLKGADIALRIAGRGAGEMAALMYSVLSDKNRTKGKVRLENMLKSGRELRVFEMRDTDLRRFSREARRYGVLYTLIKDRTADNGITDVLVKKEDAAKVSRIYERLGLPSEPERTKPRENTGTLTRDEKKDAFLGDVLIRVEKSEKDPTKDRPGRDPLSGPSSEERSVSERAVSSGRRSVRKELEMIRKALATRERAGDTSRGQEVPVQEENRGR